MRLSLFCGCSADHSVLEPMVIMRLVGQDHRLETGGATAAGAVELVCHIDALEPSLSKTRRISSGVLETWISPGHIEIIFLSASVGPPHWEDRRPLDGYVGVVWTPSAQAVCGPLTFSAHLTEPGVQEDTGLSSGECLSAVTYETDDYALAIGTQDDEALESRTRTPPGLAGPRLPPE